MSIDSRYTDDGLPVVTEKTVKVISRHVSMTDHNEARRLFWEIVKENPVMGSYISGLADTHSPKDRASAYYDMILVYHALREQARQYRNNDALKTNEER
jgi:hypothetical protein